MFNTPTSIKIYTPGVIHTPTYMKNCVRNENCIPRH